MSEQEATKEVIEIIDNLQEDSSVTKNIKLKLTKITEILKEEGDLSLKVNKALHELETASEDMNMDSYTRSQLWNLASMLEGL